MTKHNITVTSFANIALIKYWGKRDERLMLPTKSSLSIGLQTLSTITHVSFSPHNTLRDTIILNGTCAQSRTQQKIINFLDIIRAQAKTTQRFTVTTKNNFPTAAGLASSASGFAALTLALNELLQINLSKQELTKLARRGSGSASRSILGGFVLWNKGELPDGSDSYAQQLFDHTHWHELTVIIVIVDQKEKIISSRDGMRITVQTSPFYNQWLTESAIRLEKIISAIATKNFNLVGQLTQEDCLGMHHAIHTSVPVIDYWNPQTHAIMQTIKELNEHKIPCYFTIDAGPNIKILCLREHSLAIIHKLKKQSGIQSILTSTIAPNPIVIREQPREQHDH